MNKTIGSLLLAITVWPALSPAQSAAPTWGAVLLGHLFHVGDQRMQAFAKPNPDSDKFRRTFQLPPTVPHRLTDEFVIEISVSDLVSPKDKRSKKALRDGAYQTRLMLNGKEVVVLNTLVKIPERAREVATLRIPIRGTALKDGENVLEIIPGGTHANLDDFELHGISIFTKSVR